MGWFGPAMNVAVTEVKMALVEVTRVVLLVVRLAVAEKMVMVRVSWGQGWSW